MTLHIDTSSEFGARVQQRLETEDVAWLTTVSPQGRPVPSPVWFWWDGERALVYSEAGRPKLRNIAANPQVTLNFNSDGGGNVIVLGGTAEIAAGPPATEMPGYIAKYERLIAGNGWTLDGFAADYEVPIWVTPVRLRGH